MKTLAELRNNMQANRETTRKKLQETNSKFGQQNDPRFWNLARDKSGVGSAIIRFLPARADEDSPFITTYDYGFQGPTGKWYIEDSLQTIGRPDPAAEANRVLWEGSEADKALAKKRSRRTHYIANILVISDPENPKNDGKVFLWKFGKKVMAKIKDQVEPPFKGDPSVDVFCFFGGANFRLKVKMDDGYPSYEASSFDSPSPLFGGDEAKIQAIWDQEYPLKEFLDPSRFKSYEELKKRFEDVMAATESTTSKGSGKATPKPTAAKIVEDDNTPPFEVDTTIAPKSNSNARAAVTKAASDDDEFAQLVERD